MASMVDRLRKRQFFPVTIGDETVHFRGLRRSEWHDCIEPIRDCEESNGVAIGLCLLNDDRTQVFTRAEGEDIKAFGQRVLDECDMEISVCLMLANQIIRITQEPADFGAVVKN